MTAPIVKVMVANKLPATVLAQVFLLVIAGFAVSLYILPTATGTANGILSFHTSNIPCLRCFLFARRLSAYILGHHPIFFRVPGQATQHRMKLSVDGYTAFFSSFFVLYAVYAG